MMANLSKKLLKSLALIIGVFYSQITFAQSVGINTTGNNPDSSAILDISSSDKGILIPRMSTTAIQSIINPAEGLMVFDSIANSFKYYDGTAWAAIGGSDDLGNHLATQNLQLNGHWLNSDGGTSEGIYVDTLGRVGIGGIPGANFQVDMDSIAVTHISQTSNNLTTNLDFYQSFTPTEDGQLLSIEFNHVTGSTAVTYNLFEGEGTGGNNIYSATLSNPSSPLLFNGVTLNNAQIYTIQVLNAGNVFEYFDGDAYPGGMYDGDSELDMAFKVNFKIPRTGFIVSDSSVIINDYALPVVDGSAGQILATDGNGALNWSSVGSDNLGNHIANRNMHLGSYYLSNNGTNNGLQLQADNSIKVRTSGVNRVAVFDSNAPTKTSTYIEINNINGTRFLMGANGAGFTGGPVTDVVLANWSLGGMTFHTNAQERMKIDSLGKVGIGTTSPNASAILDLSSSDKGILIPRMTTTAINNIVSPATGLLVFDNTLNSFHFYNGTAWTEIGGGGVNTDNQDLSLSGNNLSLTNDPTTDPIDLSVYLDNTDQQDLSLSGHDLSLTNDPTTDPVNLSAYLDNTDTQQLTFSNDSLYLTNGGNPIDLSGLSGSDNMGDHTATQNLQSNGNWLSNDGGNEGIYIDATGKVGIGKTPQSQFHVQMSPGVSASAPHITQPLSSNPLPSIHPQYQSFTPTLSGILDSIYIKITGSGTSSYKLREGDGDTGTILYEGTHTNPTEQAFSFGSGVALTEGQSYSITYQNSAGGHTYHYQSNNPYSGGSMNGTLLFDMEFTVYMKNEGPGFRVSETGVTIKEYTLPATDGTADQVLTTNGSGAVSWANPSSGNADNLGNHIATQGIELGSNWISNNGNDTTGLQLGVSNNILVSTATTNRPAVFESKWSASPSAYIEVNNVNGTRALFGADGPGFAGGAVTDVVLGNWTKGSLKLFSNYLQRMEIDTVGRVGIGRVPTTNKLEVEGTASKTGGGNWVANSDARLKKNITPLSSEKMLEKLLALQGVTYEWDDTQTGSKRPEGTQYGFTAQNIQSIFPTLVTEDNLGFLQTPYGTYDAMTVEAIRALNDKIENLEEKNTQLESQNLQLQSQLNELTALKSSFAELKAMMKKTDATDNESSSEAKE